MSERFLRYPIRGQKFSYSVEIREHLVSKETAFQQIDVYDTYCFGKVLTLDHHVQLATLDEFAYHEALVHIPLMSIECPKRALVVGGGDGGVLRELCRWKELESIDMVEIDGAVVETCRHFLPELSEGAFDDPRVHLHIEDAFPFMAGVRELYDIVVMDITDLYEGEDGALSESLFTEKFHRDTRQALTESGFVVSQADNHVFCPYSMEGLVQTLSKTYPHVGTYQAIVPSFGGFSGFCWASKSGSIRGSWPGGAGLELRYLNELTYNLAMSDFGFRSFSVPQRV